MTLTFREAAIEDARVLFDWRNDPATRRSSHDMAELAFDAHISWLNATLADPLRQLFIVEEDGRPIGTVRVDQEANGSAELSWTVAPEARGRGMAKRMVRLVADEVSGARGVRAEVKAGNEASIKVAEAAGMRLSRQEGEVLHFARPGSTHKG